RRRRYARIAQRGAGDREAARLAFAANVGGFRVVRRLALARGQTLGNIVLESTTTLRIERHAADRSSRRRVEQLAKIRHLEEEITMTNTMHRDGEEENRQHCVKDDKRRCVRRQRRARRRDEQLLRDDQHHERQRKQHERGEKTAGLNTEVRPQREKRKRQKERQHETTGEMHLVE